MLVKHATCTYTFPFHKKKKKMKKALACLPLVYMHHFCFLLYIFWARTVSLKFYCYTCTEDQKSIKSNKSGISPTVDHSFDIKASHQIAHLVCTLNCYRKINSQKVSSAVKKKYDQSVSVFLCHVLILFTNKRILIDESLCIDILFIIKN